MRCVRCRRSPAPATRRGPPWRRSRQGSRDLRLRGGGSPGLTLREDLLERLDETPVLFGRADRHAERRLHAEARHGPYDHTFLQEAMEDVAATPGNVEQDEVGPRGHVLEAHGRELVAQEVPPGLVHPETLED